MKEIDYSILPEHIRAGAKRYIEERIPPGNFLTAVICNDLRESFGRADPTNIARMFDIVYFFYNETPSACWGSKEKMEKWLEGDCEHEWMENGHCKICGESHDRH